MLRHWESRADQGQSHAINLGFAHSSAEIMAYLNSDDLLLPGALHYVANYFAQHPEIDVVYGHRIIIDENDQEIGRWVLPPHNSKVLTVEDFVPQETLFWRRRIWNKVGGIDESFKFAMDWDLLLRFQHEGAKFKRLPRFLGAFRVHTQQKTSAEMEITGKKEIERLLIRYHGRVLNALEIKRQGIFYLLQHVGYQLLYKLGILRY
jgi:glycosyltransferase involved in cell wall biosynthesis